VARYRASALGQISRLQRADQQVRPQSAEASPKPFSLFPPAPQKWTHSNERARIEATGIARGSKRVLWTR